MLGSRGEQGYWCDFLLVCLESKMVRLLTILILLLRKQFIEALHASKGFFQGFLLKVSLLSSTKVPKGQPLPATKHRVAGLQDTLFQMFLFQKIAILVKGTC